MLTTSTIASSVGLPLNIPGMHGPSASSGGATSVAVSSALFVNSINVPTSSSAAVAASASDSGLGQLPRPVRTVRSTDQQDPTGSEPTIADAIGGFTLDGHAFPSVLYSSQAFAESFAHQQEQVAENNATINAAKASASSAAESYNRTLALSSSPMVTTASMEASGIETIPTGDSTASETGEATEGTREKTPAPTTGDSQPRLTLVVSQPRVSLRASGTSAYEGERDSQSEPAPLDADRYGLGLRLFQTFFWLLLVRSLA